MRQRPAPVLSTGAMDCQREASWRRNIAKGLADSETINVFVDEPFPFRRGRNPRCCCACRQPIAEGQRSARVEFNNDPSGANGFTGDYHLACSRPFASMARIINWTPRF
jgi:hypothetical protein